jgi:hypothetical protein
MDDERDFKNAAERTEMYLEAMTHLKGTTGTPGDVHDFPNGAIRDVIVDLMHYAYRRNAGKSPDDIFYIDVNKEFELAKKQFIAEKERVPLTIDPKLEEIHKALSERQQEERTKLVLQQAADAKKYGDSPELHGKHVSQFAAQEKTFTEERKRYVEDYHRARDLSDALERREKIDALTLAASSKLTK